MQTSHLDRKIQPRWISSAALCVAAAIFAGFAGAGESRAQVIVDDFEDGVVDNSLISPIGSAVVVESNGRLSITVFKQGDGIRIAAPPGATSFSVEQEINEPEFDIGEAINFKALTIDPDNGQEFAVIHARMLRPFWNFCVYDIMQGDSSSTIGIFCGRGLSSEKSCPDAKDLRLDWLPPLPGTDQDRVVYQVRNKDGKWRFGKSRPSDLKHDDGDLTGYTITFSHIIEEFCND